MNNSILSKIWHGEYISDEKVHETECFLASDMNNLFTVDELSNEALLNEKINRMCEFVTRIEEMPSNVEYALKTVSDNDTVTITKTRNNELNLFIQQY